MSGPAVDFEPLCEFLVQVPAIVTNESPSRGIGRGAADGRWWVKFGIDVGHPLAWHVVQEFAHVLNLLSLEGPLPTLFKPVSPPPYMNGGPEDFLSWVIECDTADMTPATVTQWLHGRLPRPVNDLGQWKVD